MTKNDYKYIPDGIAIECYTPHLSKLCYPIESTIPVESAGFSRESLNVPIGTVAYFTGTQFLKRLSFYNVFVGEIRGKTYNIVLDYETWGRHWHVPKELNK